METNTVYLLSQISELKATIAALQSAFQTSEELLKRSDTIVLAECHLHNTRSASSQSAIVNIVSELSSRVDYIESKIIAQTAENSKLLTGVRAAMETYQSYYGNCTKDSKTPTILLVDKIQPSPDTRRVDLIKLELDLACAKLCGLEAKVDRSIKLIESTISARMTALEARVDNIALASFGQRLQQHKTHLPDS